ncbi:hypothetical protein J3458_022595 [Metarhizium acridum]|uniref:uncharacterized protein n=1 Tax=Metarhizium acridum TaxID=92637 RepID=UPI001C6C9CB1|nr:hypothetical protein J3458_022595 [Metarhizium acridum]
MRRLGLAVLGGGLRVLGFQSERGNAVALWMEGFSVVDLSYARALCAGMKLAEGGDIADLWFLFVMVGVCVAVCLWVIGDGRLNFWGDGRVIAFAAREREREVERRDHWPLCRWWS